MGHGANGGAGAAAAVVVRATTPRRSVPMEVLRLRSTPSKARTSKMPMLAKVKRTKRMARVAPRPPPVLTESGARGVAAVAAAVVVVAGRMVLIRTATRSITGKSRPSPRTSAPCLNLKRSRRLPTFRGRRLQTRPRPRCLTVSRMRTTKRRLSPAGDPPCAKKSASCSAMDRANPRHPRFVPSRLRYRLKHRLHRPPKTHPTTTSRGARAGGHANPANRERENHAASW